MKTPIFATLILAALAGSAFADPVAMADSRGTYEVSRLSTTLEGRAGIPTVIQSSDRLSAKDAPVQVQLSNGETALLGTNSSVSFVDAGTLSLESGDMVLAMAPASATAVVVDTLRIVPVVEPVQKIAASNGGILVQIVKDGEMAIKALDKTFTVVDNAIGKQIAVVGKDDTVRFLRDTLGNWVPAGNGELASMQGSGTTGTGGGAAGNKAAGKENRRRKAAWWKSPIVIAGAAVGGAAVIGGTAYAINENNKSDDDDEDDDNGPFFFPPSSPILVDSTPGQPDGE